MTKKHGDDDTEQQQTWDDPDAETPAPEETPAEAPAEEPLATPTSSTVGEQTHTKADAESAEV